MQRHDFNLDPRVLRRGLIVYEKVPIHDDSIETLTERIHSVEHRLLVDAVATLLEERR